MGNVNFIQGSAANFLALANKDANTLYFLDNGQLYKGDMLLSNNVVLIPEGGNYPTTGVSNTVYAKASGECAFWNGTSYTLISHSVMTELEALEDRINATIENALLYGGVDVTGIIQRSVTEVTSKDVSVVGVSAFSNCDQLVSVNFPNATWIDSYAFKSCSNLRTVIIPNVNTITTNGFYGCSRLKDLELPAIVLIETKAFQSCSSLAKLVLSGDSVAMLTGADAFSNTPIGNGSGYIYVPDSLVSSYKSAPGWSTYSAQIKSINELV